MRKFIAFDIGGTLIKYGVLTDKGNFLERNETATQAEFGGPEVLRKVKEIGDGLIKRYSIGGICISTAGQVDSKKGEILYASSLIPEYTGTPIKKELEAYFRLPVEVENDVNCAGLAESWIGKGRDAKSLFCLTVGTGIGGSYIIDNKLHTGHSYSGGEIGYIPIEGDQFQELASTRILIKNVARRKEVAEESIDGKIIFENARKGDVICIEEIDRMVYYLSKGIATIAYMMNPEMIVIGGGITNQRDYLYPLIKKQLKKDIIPAILKKTKIEIAGNLNDAGMIGALRFFLLQESMQPFNKITTLIESNRHKLTKGERTIATYIMKNMNDVPNNTISEMAQKIDVSESMITRFCKKLDIGSYSKLRLMAKETIIGTRIHDKADTSTLVEVKQGYVDILNRLETLNNTLDIATLKDQFALSDRLFLYGTGEMEYVNQLTKYKLMQYGISVDAFSSKYEMDMSKFILKPQTIVVGLSLSGYDKRIMEMLKFASELGCMTVGITSQQDSPIANISDLSLLLPSKDDVENFKGSISEASILFLLEVLFKELQNNNYKKIRESSIAKT